MSSPVKKRCWDQREALPDEPRCVICDRYGEYVCDETDDDICSLECKATLLHNLSKTPRLPTTLPKPPPKFKFITTDDDCFYVRATDDAVSANQSSNTSSYQTDDIRKSIQVQVQGNAVPPPILSFSSCGNLPERLQENLEIAGYELPTPVQMQAIPAAFTGKDLLVSADTGSGKTASFLVPLVSNCVKYRLGNSSDQKKPLAIVLEPTRELCVQVEEQAKLLGKGMPFKTALVVGGDAMAGQSYRLQKGVELIIGTPGRLIDLLAKHDDIIELDEVFILVLDEVDCMLQRGFRDQVMQIFKSLFQPQMLMYSATITPEVEKMAISMSSRDLICVSSGKPNTPNEAVKQIAIWVESKLKKKKLFEIIASKQHFKPPVVVFVGSRIGADLLSEAITVTTGIKALSIHGEKPMKERREILRLFLTGEVSVVVATGVLGRGVDLLRVRQVIIFDMPNSIKEYIHQIGRASRLGENGTAILFVNEENKNLFRELIEVLKSSGAAVPRSLLIHNIQLLLTHLESRRRGSMDSEESC
ncbi:hypothetical protein Sjap_025499 [Stephania japonica]|uniref:RNA helicase n=1 Tax=Stephania japonica TaxID=461633 RepID=A0AAP0E9K6_9MAGN